MTDPLRDALDWNEDCMRWRGRVLTGKFRHWCWDWDGLPIDETTPEWPCTCFEKPSPIIRAEEERS